MSFADNLKKLRLKNQLTQKETAEQLGITCRTLQNYESGYCMPRTGSMARKIAKLFGVPISELFAPEDFYLINAVEKGGIKAERELRVLLSELTALYAGGKLSEKDKSLVISTLNDIYWDSKEKARQKYTPNNLR